MSGFSTPRNTADKYFKAAQENNVAELQAQIGSGVDRNAVNFDVSVSTHCSGCIEKDDFYCTPSLLMRFTWCISR
jgi:hypothetical protein